MCLHINQANDRGYGALDPLRGNPEPLMGRGPCQGTLRDHSGYGMLNLSGPVGVEYHLYSGNWSLIPV